MRCPKFLLVACWLILLVTAQDDTNNSVEKRVPKRYCGDTLISMLMFLCDSVYKRSGSADVEMMNWLPSEPLMNNPFLYMERSYLPFKPRDNAVSLIPRQYKRQRHGVADECCSKPCTLSELSSYCGTSSR